MAKQRTLFLCTECLLGNVNSASAIPCLADHAQRWDIAADAVCIVRVSREAPNMDQSAAPIFRIP